MKKDKKKKRMHPVLHLIISIIKTSLIAFFIIFIFMIGVQKLSNNNLSVGGIRLFTVVSESMVPRYEIGDVLLIKEVDLSEIKKGDNLCYQGLEGDYAGKVITHEVKDIVLDQHGKKSFKTEGIANVLTDPLVSEEQVYGVVQYKTVILSFISKLAYNRVTFYMCIFIPIIGLVIYYFAILFSQVSKKLDEKADEILSQEDEDYNIVKDLEKFKKDLSSKKKK